MRLLLISNSTNRDEEFLTYPLPNIKNFLGEERIECLFIPYACVRKPWDELESLVNERFSRIGFTIKSIHHEDPVKAVKSAKAIVVSGGNTWNLLHHIHKNKLIEPIRERVLNEKIPYIGWSAGANLACPTIKTTNDMPIIDPIGFDALNLVPFQINPHFLPTENDKNFETHGGETREERILEFTILNPNVCVAGLRERCMFLVEDDNIKMIGETPLSVFINNEIKKYELSSDFNFLMKR